MLDQAHGDTPMVVTEEMPGYRLARQDLHGGAARYDAGMPGHTARGIGAVRVALAGRPE